MWRRIRLWLWASCVRCRRGFSLQDAREAVEVTRFRWPTATKTERITFPLHRHCWEFTESQDCGDRDAC